MFTVMTLALMTLALMLLRCALVQMGQDHGPARWRVAHMPAIGCKARDAVACRGSP